MRALPPVASPASAGSGRLGMAEWSGGACDRLIRGDPRLLLHGHTAAWLLVGWPISKFVVGLGNAFVVVDADFEFGYGWVWVCRTFKFQRVPTCFCHAEEVILLAAVGGRSTRDLVESSRAKLDSSFEPLEFISLISFAIQADSGSTARVFSATQLTSLRRCLVV